MHMQMGECQGKQTAGQSLGEPEVKQKAGWAGCAWVPATALEQMGTWLQEKPCWREERWEPGLQPAGILQPEEQVVAEGRKGFQRSQDQESASVGLLASPSAQPM